MLKPILRFCLRNSIRAREILEAVRGALIELSLEELEKKGEKATLSRISVMTGLNRRDVTRILRQGVKIDNQSNLVTRVLGQWEQDLRFASPAHKPKVLSYKGDKSEFKKLVKSISKDINPATMLYELKRMGAVEESKEGIRLVKSVNYFQQSPEKGLGLLSRDMNTFVEAVEENLFQTQETRNLHLRTEYDNIFKSDLPVIRKWLFETGAHFHKQARDFLSQFDKDINPTPDKDGGAKVVLGAFSWTSQEKNDD